ncbi:hypothetical protein DXG01_004746 [Tephrocybe rancida]|nr:hypothetical protein DXG01_004746 [Tephrocybe rancida]
MPEILSSPAVGAVTEGFAPEIFDDPKTVGLWPVEQRIEKIVTIETFSQPPPVYVPFLGVVGIKITYKLQNQAEPAVVTHGSIFGKSQIFEAKEDEYFVGIFGKLYDNFPAGKIRAIGFLMFNNSTGEITPYPSFLDLPDAPREDPEFPVLRLKGFTSLGLLIGFSGSVSDDAAHFLETLSVYKYSPGSGGINII